MNKFDDMAFTSSHPNFISPPKGLSKREFFAGLAMMNLQNVFLRKSGRDLMVELMKYHQTESAREALALEAVAHADALLEALSD